MYTSLHGVYIRKFLEKSQERVKKSVINSSLSIIPVFLRLFSFTFDNTFLLWNISTSKLPFITKSNKAYALICKKGGRNIIIPFILQRFYRFEYMLVPQKMVSIHEDQIRSGKRLLLIFSLAKLNKCNMKFVFL